MAVLWIASSGLLVASGIPFATPQYFAANPLASDASLPPLPDALRPMGPPKAVNLPRTEPIIAPLPNPDALPGRKDSKTVASADDEGGQTADAPQEQKSVTVSPFMDWVRKNRDSEDLARAQRDQYRKGGAHSSDDPDNDLMLNIRYPYTWNQEQPPGSSAVIYTIPKR